LQLWGGGRSLPCACLSSAPHTSTHRTIFDLSAGNPTRIARPVSTQCGSVLSRVVPPLVHSSAHSHLPLSEECRGPGHPRLSSSSSPSTPRRPPSQQRTGQRSGQAVITSTAASSWTWRKASRPSRSSCRTTAASGSSPPSASPSSSPCGARLWPSHAGESPPSTAFSCPSCSSASQPSSTRTCRRSRSGSWTRPPARWTSRGPTSSARSWSTWRA
jgi:hypothetical protein